jgi:hypothetical protein
MSTPTSDIDINSTQGIDLIETELQEIIDFGEGQYIEKRHQVLVQVSEYIRHIITPEGH